MRCPSRISTCEEPCAQRVVGFGVTRPTITVASYNMRKAVGLDRRRNPARVLQVLQEINADIVALQEADKRVGTRGAAVPHALIDDHGLYRACDFNVTHTDRLARAH